MSGETAPWWRPLLRRRLRLKAECIAAGTHNPQILNAGMGARKMCFHCGAC